MRRPTPILRQRAPAAIHASPLGPLRQRLVRALALAVVAALFLGFVGAFGTGAAPMGLRLAYWLITMLATSAAAIAVMSLLWRAPWLRPRPVAYGLVSTLAISLALTPIVWGVSRAMFPPAGGRPVSILWLFPSVLVVGAAMTGLNFLAARRPMQTHAAPAGAPPARFLERLPPKLRGAALHAVQAEDHYLRLHTSRGSDLILMRLADAVAELEGIEGAQTHRSWWVARAAVDDARRGDGRAVLRLVGGIEAPVSRRYARALREAGWF